MFVKSSDVLEITPVIGQLDIGYFEKMDLK